VHPSLKERQGFVFGFRIPPQNDDPLSLYSGRWRVAPSGQQQREARFDSALSHVFGPKAAFRTAPRPRRDEVKQSQKFDLEASHSPPLTVRDQYVSTMLGKKNTRNPASPQRGSLLVPHRARSARSSQVPGVSVCGEDPKTCPPLIVYTCPSRLFSSPWITPPEETNTPVSRATRDSTATLKPIFAAASGLSREVHTELDIERRFEAQMQLDSLCTSPSTTKVPLT